MLANNRMLTFKLLKKTRIPAIVLFTPIGLDLFPNSAVKRSTDNAISTVVCCNWCSQMKPALAELQQPPIAYIWRQIRIHLFTHYFSFLTFQLWFELFVDWRLICVGYCHGSQCCWLFCRCIDLICFYSKVLMVKVDHFSWSACAKLPQLQSLVLHFFLVDMANMVCLLCSAEVAPTVLRVSRGVAEKGVGHWAVELLPFTLISGVWVCLLFDAFALNGPLHLF